jgi:hypothetical protein
MTELLDSTKASVVKRWPLRKDVTPTPSKDEQFGQAWCNRFGYGS